MLLEIKNLKAGFIRDKDYLEVIKGISLTIDQDEVVGLVGESGCGKTITALSIMKLLPKSALIKEGSIVFNAKDLAGLSEAEMCKVRGRDMGMVFQEPFTALNPVIRVGDQITETILIHRNISKKEAKAMAFDLLKKVRIENAQNVYFNYPHQLSGGQRQRALIASALALKPKLLIADEPTTALDVTTQNEILKLLLELKQEMKMSVLFITHDFGIINEVADRVLVMKDGGIVERASKKIIMHLPQHPYTVKLLNAVPRMQVFGKEKVSDKVKSVLVNIKSVSKSFAIERGLFKSPAGRVEALNNVDLKIKKGQTMGLVGESGCGKTTLGKVILGLTAPDKGEVLIEGSPITEILKKAPHRLREMMQVVFQDPYGSLDPRMSAADIILEGPSILGKPKTEKASILAEVLKRVHLKPGDSAKYPHQFSGGQRQRIAIARALATNAKFLILDEPVSSLDVLIQKDILDLLRSLQRRLGLTYLFISHDLRVVEVMADEVAVMHRGAIVETASSRDIYKNPKHPYTKHLLSSIPQL